MTYSLEAVEKEIEEWENTLLAVMDQAAEIRKKLRALKAAKRHLETMG